MTAGFNSVSNHNQLLWDYSKNCVLEPRLDGLYYRHCRDRFDPQKQPGEIDFQQITALDFKPGESPGEEIWSRLTEFLTSPVSPKLLHFHDPRPLIPRSRESVSAYYLDRILGQEWRGLLFIDYFNYTTRSPQACIRDIEALLDRSELGGLQYCHGRHYHLTHELYVLAAPRSGTLPTKTKVGQRQLFRMD